jgi:hypothetical protein
MVRQASGLMLMAITQAIEFLRTALSGGPLSANDVRAQAKAAGVSWAAVRRGKSRIGIVTTRKSVGSAGDGQWFWSLPKGQDAQAQGVQAAQVVQAAPAAQPSMPRTILVRRPGVVPAGPNELSWEQWQALGSETGKDCPRIREFLRQREATSSLGGQTNG